MHILFGNYGQHTIALIQWAYEQRCQDVTVVHVDTGWAGERWADYLLRAKNYVAACGFRSVSLRSPQTFPEQVVDRGHFPSQKFQWCAPFLKGLPLMHWADQVDSSCQAKVMLGSTRLDSPARQALPEYLVESEHYGGRTVWYPLFRHTAEERSGLLTRAAFTDAPLRSQECQPCLHAQRCDLTPFEQARLQQLEAKVKQPFQLATTDQGLANFDRGCGSPYACGE